MTLAERGVIVSVKVVQMGNGREIGVMVFQDGNVEIVCLMDCRRLRRGRIASKEGNV